MKVYARIEGGVVVEVIHPPVGADGVQVDIPIADRFTAEFVATLVDITDTTPMPLEQWTYDGKVFAAPVPYQPSPEELLSQNKNMQEALKTSASSAMTPYLLTLNLGNGTADQIATAKLWQAYYFALDSLDVTVAEPAWPVIPS